MSAHLLRVWHLARNFAKHMKGCFGATRRGRPNAAWRTFYNAFWAFLLKTDRDTIESFDAEWDELRELLVETASATEDVIHHALTYLGGGEHDEGGSFSIFDLKSKWAYRFTWSTFTLGANSTQRGEGVFSLIKARVRPGSLLTQLYKKLYILDQEIVTLSEALLTHSVRLWSRTVNSAALPQFTSTSSTALTVNLCTARSAVDPRSIRGRSATAHLMHTACVPHRSYPAIHYFGTSERQDILHT